MPLPILELIVTLFPAFIANMAPLWYGGGKDQIDGGKNWRDGRPILGKGKTWRGFYAALFVGAAVGIYSFGVLHKTDALLAVWVGFLMGLGTMAGDLGGSFLKRRLNVPSGAPFLTDQIGFMVGAILFTWPYLTLDIQDVVVALIITYVLHVFTNRVAYATKFKEVPW